MSVIDIFRLPDDKLPTEYPWREALRIYTKQFSIFVGAVLIGFLLIGGTAGVNWLVIRWGIWPLVVVLPVVMAVFLVNKRLAQDALEARLSREAAWEEEQRFLESIKLHYEKLPSNIQKMGNSWDAARAIASTTWNWDTEANEAAWKVAKRTTWDAQEIRILVVEGEASVRELLHVSLQKSGYKVTTTCNGHEALRVFDEQSFDLVLLDVMIPEIDGFTLCAELRQRSDVPVVMLSALNRPDDIVYGFSVGADDYICKPFTFREIEVRLQAILRRVNWASERIESRVMSFDDIVLNDELHQVKVRDNLVHLTPTEYQLLRHLMSRPNRPVSKNDLFQTVWGYDLAGGTNLVEVAVRRLREKIEQNPSDPVYLVTVSGARYKFNTQHAPKRELRMA